MGSMVENGWVLSLSLAAKCGGVVAAADSARLLFLAALFLLAVSSTALLHWAAPGGPAWGRYWWSRKKWPGPGFRYHLGGREEEEEEEAAIPGPRGLPIVGSMGLMTGLSHRKLAAAAAAFGAKRLMAISVGETRAVVTADPDVAREILSSPVFADRPVKESAHGLMFRRAIGFAPHGAYWRSLRRVAAANLFSPKHIAGSADRRAAIAEEMVAALKSAAARGGPTKVRGVLKTAALSHMVWMVFGKTYDLTSTNGGSEEARELRSMVDEGYELLGKLNWSDHLPALAGLDLQRIRSGCARLVPRVNRFVGRIIDDHRFGPARDPDTAPDFVDVLLSLPESERLSDEDMRAVLWEMIFRGTDTVAVLLEWVLARAALHRDVQARAHDELDRALGPTAAASGHAHAHALPYLHAIIKETLRLHPPGPLLSWARLATSDTRLSGRHVPAGTTAVVNMWAIARDPAIWSRPEEFLPGRFVGPGAEAAGLSVFGSDLRLAPFGSGRRSCPGKALAMAAVASWVAALLHEFEWAQPPGAPLDLSEVMRLSCEMAAPLAVDLRPRNRTPSYRVK